MAAEWMYVLNLGNSIIGVSVLAMPFCLRQCGLILGLLLLLVSAYLTRISCNLLLKTAKQARRTSYEYVALHSFGSFGKLAVETSIIGLLMGTCVAFYVIIGDLGPSIVSKWFGVENTWSLRTVMLVLTALFVVLPLGLLRKVEQLSSISALSFSFYTVLIAQIILISFPTLLSFSWVAHARYWRTEGLFQCLSIFSLAFTCHTQVFVVYESLPDRTERKMNDVVKGAVNMVAFCYIMVGFFGYVAFCEQGIKGDILMNFKTSFVNDLLKMGFVISVALSFPMMIFPCRASINTLISGSQGPSLENPTGGEHIPQGRHRAITAVIVFFTLLVGIAIPNVETVLGLTGSTTGTMIGYIFPAVMFLKCLPKGPGVKSAQAVLFIGIIIMFASTYSTLQSRPDEIKPIVDINIQEDQFVLENKPLDENQIAEQNLEVPGGDVLNIGIQDGVIDGDSPLGNGKGGEVPMADWHLVGGQGEGQEQMHDGNMDDGKLEMEADETQKDGDVDDRGNEAEIVADKRQEPPIPHAPADSDEVQAGKDIKPVDEIIKDIGEEEEREKKDVLENAEEVVKEEEQIQGGPEDRGPQGIDLLEEHGDEVKHVKDEDLDEDEDDEAHRRLEEKVEMKVKEQDIKHEEQQKMIEELKEKQDQQEKMIEQQQEVIEVLKKQHDAGSMELVAGDDGGGGGGGGGQPAAPFDAGGGDSLQAKPVGGDSLQAKPVGGDSLQAKPVDQDTLQQQQQQQQQDLGQGNPAAIQQPDPDAHHQVVHHDAAAAAVPADNLGKPQVVEVIKHDAVDARVGDNDLEAHKPRDIVDNQQQAVHEIHLPPADLINQVGGDANLKAVAQQPQPRDILGVDGIKHDNQDDEIQDEKDAGKEVIPDLENQEPRNEVHDDQKKTGSDGDSKGKNNHHHKKKHQSVEIIEREKRDAEADEDADQNPDVNDDVLKEPGDQVVKSQDAEIINEDQEKALYEDHLANLNKLKEENDANLHHEENEPADDDLQNEQLADGRNDGQKVVKSADVNNNHGNHEHLRKEEVRR